MRSLLVAALLFVAMPGWAQETTLTYDAFVGDAKVGGAEVKIETDASRYSISGEAWTVGIAHFMTKWRSLFSSTGRLADSGPINDGFRFIEKARNKVKDVLFSDGQMTYTKNGEPRPAEVPHSLDLLSALFVARDCAAAGSEIHNGKDRFSLKLLARQSLPKSASGATERCSFELRDEDQERIDATVWLGQIAGLTVPVRVDLSGALEGSWKLHPTSLVAFQPQTHGNETPL
jgi:hypothetical protein